MFETSYQIEEDTYTPEMCRLQLDCLATILELHIDYFAKQTDIIEAKERQLLEDGRIFRYVES